MKQSQKKFVRIDNKTFGKEGVFGGRRSFSDHAKQVNNAFLVVFAQYEKAFEELAKV